MSDTSVTMQDLIDTNKARHDQSHAEEEDARPLADRIQVVLRAESCPSLHIRYTKMLPPMEHSPKKCRIVTTSRVETSTQLVCDVA